VNQISSEFDDLMKHYEEVHNKKMKFEEKMKDKEKAIECEGCEYECPKLKQQAQEIFDEIEENHFVQDNLIIIVLYDWKKLKAKWEVKK